MLVDVYTRTSELVFFLPSSGGFSDGRCAYIGGIFQMFVGCIGAFDATLLLAHVV